MEVDALLEGLDGGFVGAGDGGAGTDVEQLRQRDGHQQDDRGDDLEVQDRLGGHAPDLLRRIHARDAEHDEREDQGDDDHLNQVEEHVAGQFELLADGGGERADECADADGDQ